MQLVEHRDTFGAHENWPTRAYLKWSTSPFRIASTIGSATNLR